MASINDPLINEVETSLTPIESLPARDRRVHIIGAGPVGLLLTALLQSMDGFSVRLYEKRPKYVRTRMVKLSSYLVADSLESYQADHIDGESIQAIFDHEELQAGLAFRQSIPSDLMSLLRKWVQGFCPLNTIEQSLSDLIDARASKNVQRIAGVMSAEDAVAMLEPGDLLIDCTGSNSLLRDQLAGHADTNTLNIRLEYALVITFLYGQNYDCNEYCKYNKNIENPHYKFIPMVHRTHYDGSVSHVTGIVNISAEDYEAMPSRFDGEWLRDNFPSVAQSMDRFIDKIKEETEGQVGPLDEHQTRISESWVGVPGAPASRGSTTSTRNSSTCSGARPTNCEGSVASDIASRDNPKSASEARRSSRSFDDAPSFIERAADIE